MSRLFERILALYAQGLRQRHECTCGPASAILAGAALGLHKKNEEDWRNPAYSRWVPTDQFLVRGMALHELQFTTEFVFANQLQVSMTRAFQENEDLFRRTIVEAVVSEESVVIFNYCQDDFFGETGSTQGNPHYSVLAGYNAKDDKILIADVDSEVKEPYWVDISALFKSMSRINPAFGIPRGWLVLKRINP
jgi:hypothetical protein